MRAEIERLIEQLSLLTTCAAKLVETLVNLKEVELAERQNDLEKEKPLVGFSSHQIRAEETAKKARNPTRGHRKLRTTVTTVSLPATRRQKYLGEQGARFTKRRRAEKSLQSGTRRKESLTTASTSRQ